MTTLTSLAENPKEARKISFEIIGIQAGLITSVSLIVYFIIMKSINLLQSEIAWALNTVILGAGIMLTYIYYRSKTQLNIDYLSGLLLGIITTAVSVTLFAIFIYLWLSKFDTALLQLLKSNTFFMGGELTTPTKAAASIMIEGGCSGLIISFMLMQYYKSGLRKM
jgi:hypothetical protein